MIASIGLGEENGRRGGRSGSCGPYRRRALHDPSGVLHFWDV